MCSLQPANKYVFEETSLVSKQRLYSKVTAYKEFCEVPAATIAIESSTSTNILATISCKPILSDGTGFHWYLYTIFTVAKTSQVFGFFLMTECETGILYLTF